MATRPYGAETTNGGSPLAQTIQPGAIPSDSSIHTAPKQPAQSNGKPIAFVVDPAPGSTAANGSSAAAGSTAAAGSSATAPDDPRAAAAAAAERKRAYHREYQRKRKGAKAGSDTGSATGSTSRKAAAQATVDLNNILFSLHMMGASLLKMPSLVLTEEEAKHLATAITRVTELYDVPIMDEKTRAWMNLGIVGFELYGTRIIAEMAERRKKRPAPPPMVIPPFRPQQHPPPPPPQQNPIDAFFNAEGGTTHGRA